MIKQKKRLLNTLNHSLFTAIFILFLAVVAGTIGCSDSGGGGSKAGYQLVGYDGVFSESSTQQSLASAVGNQGLEFYAEFPWFVNLTYQVFDLDNWPVTDLTVDDFTVLEDGVEVSKLASEMNIRKRDALPSGYSYDIKTVLFLDNTPSADVPLEKMLECGQVIVDNIDEKQQQEIAIAAYNEVGEAEVVQDFTSILSDLNESLLLTDGIQPSYGTTNFYQGVIGLLSLWKDNHSPSDPAFQQGFLVAVTDGKDTTSLSDVDDAIAARGDKQVIVVAVGADIPDSILTDLERLGNGGFYHVTEPSVSPDEGWDKKENLCENMLEVQKRMMAYTDGFYWLRYKTPITSGGNNSSHTVNLSVVDNGNSDADGEIAGTFNSDTLFSGQPSIYFNTSASDPNGIFDEETGITEKVIMIERGQGAGEVTETIRALTYSQSGTNPSQYVWTSDAPGVVTVKKDTATSSTAIVTAVGPGDAVLTVTDTVNNVTQTLTVKVEVRAESFQMIQHIVASKAPWFVDTTFQVRSTESENNQWNWADDLAREDVTVLENNVKVDMEDSETHLRKRDNIPSSYSYTLKTVLHIDNSPSISGNLDLIKDAARAFAKRALVNDPSDRTDLGPLLDANNEMIQQEIAVVSYGEDGETILVQDFTTDLDTVETAIDSIVRGYGPIDFYGGMLDSLRLWTIDNSPYDAGDDFVQGVVVVLSDGWQSNQGFYDRQAVLDETGSKQIISVSVGNDLVSSNSDDLVAFGKAGFYSVPDPGNKTKVKLISDDGEDTKNVWYTDLEQTLMHIQHEIYAYANSFYWLDYKSKLDPAPVCDRRESVIISINNNSNTASGNKVSGSFESCNFFEGIDGMIYVNQTVTNPDGISGDIDLRYVMLGSIPLNDPTYALEAFTYDNDGIKNTPAYEWLVSNQNIVKVTPVSGSYANSRATLSLPAVKSPGTASLRIDDTGNSVWANIDVNVSKYQLPFPIAYYPFNGNADDESGNGYDGEAFGATLKADRNGNSNSAYFFDGKDDYIALDAFYGSEAGAIAGTFDEITVCAWFKTAELDKSMRIISFNYENFWELIVHYGKPVIAANIDGQVKAMQTLRNYSDNQWHFVAATIDTNGDMTIQVDGTPDFENYTIDNPVSTATRYGFIGARSETDVYNGERYPVYFSGDIDDVIVFDQVLTDGDIQILSDVLN